MTEVHTVGAAALNRENYREILTNLSLCLHEIMQLSSSVPPHHTFL